MNKSDDINLSEWSNDTLQQDGAWYILDSKYYKEMEYKAETLDKMVKKIEKKGNIVRNLSGWAFDVFKVYKQYKEEIKHVRQIKRINR